MRMKKGLNERRDGGLGRRKMELKETRMEKGKEKGWKRRKGNWSAEERKGNKLKDKWRRGGKRRGRRGEEKVIKEMKEERNGRGVVALKEK